MKTTASEIEQQPTTWIARVKMGLKMREAGEEMIAKALADRKASLKNDALFFRECEDLFGWARSTAYRHLNPEQLQKDRDRAGIQRARRPDDRDIEPKPTEAERLALKNGTAGYNADGKVISLVHSCDVPGCSQVMSEIPLACRHKLCEAHEIGCSGEKVCPVCTKPEPRTIIVKDDGIDDGFNPSSAESKAIRLANRNEPASSPGKQGPRPGETCGERDARIRANRDIENERLRRKWAAELPANRAKNAERETANAALNAEPEDAPEAPLGAGDTASFEDTLAKAFPDWPMDTPKERRDARKTVDEAFEWLVGDGDGMNLDVALNIYKQGAAVLTDGDLEWLALRARRIDTIVDKAVALGAKRPWSDRRVTPDGTE